jgi:hypothetical protein
LARPEAPASEDDLARLRPFDAQRYRAIKPSKDEMKWMQIPWLTDLNEGLKVARKEGRPLLLWVSGDDPLERC